MKPSLISIALLLLPGAVWAHQCRLFTDAEQVTHILAATDADGFACWGYLQARDRGWEMDFFRRAEQGRLAEVLGRYSDGKDESKIQDNLTQDFEMRLMDFPDAADRILKSLSKESREELQAFSDGVNEGFKDFAAQAYEFKQLEYRPEPWRPQDTIAVLLLESFDNTFKSATQDIVDDGRAKKFGPTAPSLFSQDDVPWATTILKPGEYPSKSSQESASLQSPSQSLAISRSLQELFGHPWGLSTTGSNNWAVDASHGVNGHALFANDPHLPLNHPPFWYWIHLMSPHYNVIGASLPGTPFVASGANMNVAWGLTNGYLKAGDIIAADASSVKLTEIHPVVRVRMKILGFSFTVKVPSFFVKLERTEEGWPVLPNKTLPGTSKSTVLVMHWTGYDIDGDDVDHILSMMQANSVEEFDAALSHVGIPCWNFTFADTHGHIGYRLSGRGNKHESPPHYGVAKTTVDDVKSWSMLSSNEMPHLLNPARGYIATANNRHWGPDSLYNEGRAYTESFRAHRIEQLLKGVPKHSASTFVKIQCDTYDTEASYLVPLMVKAVEGQPGLAPLDLSALQVLKAWDFSTPVTCKACGLFRRWENLLFDTAQLEQAALYHILSDNPSYQVFKPSTLVALRQTLHQAALDMSVSSIIHASTEVKSSPEGLFKAWGNVHKNYFDHLAGWDVFPNSDFIPTRGDEETVNPGHAHWVHGEFRVYEGASHRFIAELSTPPKLYAVLPGSNIDEEHMDLHNPNGPWQRWYQCQPHRQLFPLDWSTVNHAQDISF